MKDMKNETDQLHRMFKCLHEETTEETVMNNKIYDRATSQRTLYSVKYKVLCKVYYTC